MIRKVIKPDAAVPIYNVSMGELRQRNCSEFGLATIMNLALLRLHSEALSKK